MEYDHQFHWALINYIGNREFQQTFQRLMYLIHLTTAKALSVPGRTEDTLKELGAANIPMIYVFNKVDLCGMGEFATVQGSDKLYMSAKSRNGIDTLLTLITGKLSGRYRDCEFIIPYKRGDVVSYLNDNAVVHKMEYREDGVYMETNVSHIDAARYAVFVVLP